MRPQFTDFSNIYYRNCKRIDSEVFVEVKPSRMPACMALPGNAIRTFVSSEKKFPPFEILTSYWSQTDYCICFMHIVQNGRKSHVKWEMDKASYHSRPYACSKYKHLPKGLETTSLHIGCSEFCQYQSSRALHCGVEISHKIYVNAAAGVAAIA